MLFRLALLSVRQTFVAEDFTLKKEMCFVFFFSLNSQQHTDAGLQLSVCSSGTSRVRQTCAHPSRVPAGIVLRHLLHFSLIYQLAEGGLIYEILDWDKMPVTILIALGTAFIMVRAVHMVVFTIYKLRVFVWKSHCRSRQVSNVSGNDESNQTGPKIAPENTEADRNRQESVTV